MYFFLQIIGERPRAKLDMKDERPGQMPDLLFSLPFVRAKLELFGGFASRRGRYGDVDGGDSAEGIERRLDLRGISDDDDAEF